MRRRATGPPARKRSADAFRISPMRARNRRTARMPQIEPVPVSGRPVKGCAKRRGKRVALSWMPDWSWGLPLLVLTIVAHVSAIVVTAKMLGKYRGSDPHKASRFIIFVALAALASAVYLTLEAAAWAALYLWVGALSAWRAAMLYSRRRDDQLRSRQHLSGGPLATARRDRSRQRRHPLWPDDRVSLRRYSPGLAAAAGLTRGGPDQLAVGSCGREGCQGCRSHSFQPAGSPNFDVLRRHLERLSGRLVSEARYRFLRKTRVPRPGPRTGNGDE